MSFHFKKIKKSLIEGDFVVGDQTLKVWVNGDIITNKKIKEINKTIAEAKKISEDEIDVTGSDFMIAMLVTMLDHWDAVDAKPTAAFFEEQPAVFVKDLFAFCSDLITPKAQTAGA